MALRILHTSDLHLGHRLYGRRREEEQAAVLAWLVAAAVEHAVDAVFVCGDVFDTAAPSATAQEQYFGFLHALRQAGVRHTVILAGNHDSPSLLAAPQALLRPLGVHVVVEPEVVVLQDGQGQAELAVLAVPYLRERDVRQAMAGASLEEKAAAWVQGVARVYAEGAAHARDRAPGVPLVATGHLFVAGSRVVEGEGMRASVGGLDQVPAGVLPACAYTALGHVHRAQSAGGQAQVRYSGAPLALGFADAGRSKSVTLVTLHSEEKADFTELPAPCLQPLARVHGGLDAVVARLKALVAAHQRVWVEVEVQAAVPAETIRRQIEGVVQGSDVEVLCVRVPRPPVLAWSTPGERLEELSPHEVFARLLAAHGVADNERQELTAAFDVLLRQVLEADPHGETVHAS